MQLNLKGHFLGFYSRIPLLKLSNEHIYLSSKGTRSQITGPNYRIELEPSKTVFNLGFETLYFYESCMHFLV